MCPPVNNTVLALPAAYGKFAANSEWPSCIQRAWKSLMPNSAENCSSINQSAFTHGKYLLATAQEHNMPTCEVQRYQQTEGEIVERLQAHPW